MMKTIIWQQSDVIVDREVESDEIVKIISQNWDKKTVHYTHSGNCQMLKRSHFLLPIFQNIL